MAGRLKKHAEVIRLMAKGKPSMNKAILETADSDLIHCFCECALNVLKGTVPLNSQQKRKLARYKQGLRSLIQPKTSVVKKKKILQTGGFLPALLGSIIAGIAGPLLGNILK